MMKEQLQRIYKNKIFQYTIWGILFGCLFPVAATLMECYRHGLSLGIQDLLAKQNTEPLLWIIDTAPFFLGVFASLIGHRQQKLVLLNSQLEIRIKERSEELARANQVLVREIADHEKAEEDLNVSETKYRSIFENSGVGIIVTDEEERIVSWNPYAEKMLMMSADVLTGKHAQELMDPEERRKLLPLNIREKGLRNRIETHIIRGDRQFIDVDLSIRNLFDLNNRRIGSIGILVDITEQKKAETALRSAKDEAEKANRAKSDFLANISHELRTPLHGIISFANLGISKHETLSSEKLLQYFSAIKTSGDSLLTLVNELLDVSRLEEGHMTFTFERADFTQTLEMVIDEFSPLLAEKNLSIAFDRQTPVEIEMDTHRIRQLLRNLLSNAIKFSQQEQTIEFVIRDMGATVRIEVHDSGIGIPENELDIIFEKFIQSTRTNNGTGGIGLGLAISKKIVTAHYGKIWAINNPTGGASVCFEIPKVQPNQKDNT